MGRPGHRRGHGHGLAYVLRADGEGARPTIAASGASAPTVTTAVSTSGGSPATTVSPAPTGTQPTPTVTTMPAAPERLTAGSRLSLDGLGPVDIGMTLDQASAAAGAPIRIRPDDPYDGDCKYASAAGLPEVGFMVINGRIARVDVGDRGGRRITTVSGAGTGDTEEAIKRTYPRAGSVSKATPTSRPAITSSTFRPIPPSPTSA